MYLENQKQYYLENRDKILEGRKEKMECGCGSVFLKVNKQLHYKSKKHEAFIMSSTV